MLNISKNIFTFNIELILNIDYLSIKELNEIVENLLRIIRFAQQNKT
jgi:hypothetical protein